MRVAVVGGGFIGLEAALAAKEAGHEVTVLERGEVAASVGEWGSVRMFTPWSMLTTTAGRAAVGAAGLDDEAACPTGAEVRDRYLLPLAATLDVRTHHRVRGIGRLRHRKGDAIAEVRRQHDPFHLVVDTPDGPAVFVADAVLDCSGTWTDPVPAGLGGVAAAGEAALADAGLVRYGPRTDGLSGRVLVTGDGASGATAVVALAGVADVTWLTPGPDAPRFVSPPDDPLPARAALLHAAVDALHHVHHVAGRFIVALRRDGDGLHATLNDGTTLSADALVVCNGLRPDLSLHRELQVHQCYASEGTMKLAAALLGGSGDCLAEKAAGPDLLRNPEPGFFVLGSKSYGRRSDFLVRDGQRQAREVLTLLAEIA